ncbi:hypothetical protein JCM6882_009100 [Rhodosporidiobolus microsporus]
MKTLVRSLSCRSERSTEAETLFTTESRSTTATEISPQALPYDVLRVIFELAIEDTDSPKERQQTCLTIAALSSDWTEVGLRSLYSSQLTFQTKRFAHKKKRFSRFYKTLLRDDGLASAVTWLKVDLKLVKERLTPLLASCISTLSLHSLTVLGDTPFLVKAIRPTYPYSLNSLPLFLPNLLSLTLSAVWFNASTISKFLSDTCLPALTHLTTSQVYAFNETVLRDGFFSLSAQLTHLTILDPLRWTRHALLRCGPSLAHLRVAEFPRSPSSLRHVLPFLNASPHPLKTLAIHAQKIPKRPSLPDSLSILARGLILGITEKRASLAELEELTLSGQGWATSEMGVTIGLLGSVCALKDVKLVVQLEEDAKQEWVEKVDREGVW